MSLTNLNITDWVISFAHTMYVPDGDSYRNATTKEGWLYQNRQGTSPHEWSALLTWPDGIVLEHGVDNDFGYYESQQDNNLNHSPVSNPTWWVDVDPNGTSLGADDDYLKVVTGCYRHTRKYDTGVRSIHFMGYGHGAAIYSTYWDAAFSPGQFAQADNGGSPAVRMSASSDTCYYAVSYSDDDFVGALLYKVLNGTASMVAESYISYVGELASGACRIWSIGSSIGVDLFPAGIGTNNNDPLYLQDYTNILVYNDPSPITITTGPYVGMRGGYTSSIHQWGGGAFYTPDTTAPITTISSQSGVYPVGTTLNLSDTGTDQSLPISKYYRWI